MRRAAADGEGGNDQEAASIPRPRRVRGGIRGAEDDPDRARALMIAFQNGDDHAFDQLVSLCSRRIFALAYRYGFDAPSADDLVQETMVRVYRARDRYRPQAPFDAWLMRIAKNLVIGRARKQKRRKTIKLSELGGANRDGAQAGMGPELADPKSADPGQGLARRERVREVRRALEGLPESQRTALLLNRFEGMSYEEVGEVMGLKVAAVKSLLFRARQNLKSRLERYMKGE